MIGFDRFLELVQERSPYPWQLEFANRSATEWPPELVTVPTGCGKTTVVEALVWALASQAERPGIERTVGVRTVWAIDRRILVDEVFQQAAALAELLDASWRGGDLEDPLYEVAKRLQHLKDPTGILTRDELGPPLVATRWRGGIAMSPPAQHPLQAEVITSTVGQIGSRVLFRGYGLGAGSLPTGAALAACDTTICLDEAHLAEPFAATVNSVADRRRDEPNLVAPPVSVVRLSATMAPEDSGSRPVAIELSPEDKAILDPRLKAPKHATLIEPTSQSDQDQVGALVDATSRYVDEGKVKVACVCNSVRIARAVFDRLQRASKTADLMLLVGPQRPADREGIFDARVAPDDAEAPDDHPTRRDVLFGDAKAEVPLVVVATQTVEVGLDIDVEAMVTQSASAAALVQRLGRLNRAGTPGVTGHATVVRQTDFPLYELDELSAWDWLGDLPAVGDSGAVDVSLESLAEHPPPPPRRRNPAPPLIDDVVARLAETNPKPHVMVEPDIEAYLRGVRSEPNSDVSLVWRSDLFEGDVNAKTYRDALLRLAPPSPSEQLSLSLNAARNLLRNLTGGSSAKGASLRRQVLDGGDLEGEGPDEAGFRPADVSDEFQGIPYFVLRDKKWLPGIKIPTSGEGAVPLGELRVGDLIVIPTALGGSDESGLAPDAGVGTDVGDDLRSSEGSGAVPVRLTHGALMTAFEAAHPAKGPRSQLVDGRLRQVGRLARRIAEVEPGTDDSERLMLALFEALGEHPAVRRLDPRRTEIRPLTPPRDTEIVELLDEHDDLGLGEDLEAEDPADHGRDMAVLEGEDDEQRPAQGWVLVPQGEQSDPDELRRKADPPPTLAAHCREVADRAERFAIAAGLERRLIDTLVLAGLAHDLGKADPRMQGLFHGGVTPAVADLLAKSTFGTGDRARDSAAREAAGMPTGLRHEQASVGILKDAVENGDVERLVPTGVEIDLLLYLVGAHHGKSHPIPPVPSGGSPPRPYRVEMNGLGGDAAGTGDEGWNDGESFSRVARLRARLGPWALAYMEALLVLADRTVSAEGK